MAAMDIRFFKTLWGFTGSYPLAIEQTLAAGMQGIEGPAPQEPKARGELRQRLNEHKLDYIAEITTAGTYVPDRQATLQQHLDSFKAKLAQSLELEPLFITCLGGCDAWPEAQSIEFFCKAIELASDADITVSFETHRGRSLFNPWITQRVVEQIPDIQLTCDFSHWCVVCERLIDSEIDIIRQVANNAHHVHARVGYDQGPQVPNPAAPEYETALRAHQGWWEILWQAQQQRGYPFTTMTPEFGPDGYLHEAPFTREPVADLWELNTWMASEERDHFARFIQ
ncbi:sugar phosphate isomerase/epimerase family protein [Kaarinaea lacus]